MQIKLRQQMQKYKKRKLLKFKKSQKLIIKKLEINENGEIEI